jgi:hypothetical protein
VRAAFGDGAFERLQALKRRYDPTTCYAATEHPAALAPLASMRTGVATRWDCRRARPSDSLRRVRAVVMTWAPGGNLPPLLAVASVLRRRGHEVSILASGATRDAAERLGFDVSGYRRSRDPDVRVSFEAHAELMMATMAGPEIALDARDLVNALGPDMAVVDCMLPAAIAAARAAGAPTVSLVHFLYGLARTQMLRAGGAWTTDLSSLAATHRMLGLSAPGDGLSAWEATELVLVTAPRWLDVSCDAPANVIHAGPLATAVRSRPPARPDAKRPRVLLTFSTTIMEGQAELIDRVCEAAAGLDLDPVLTLGPRSIARRSGSPTASNSWASPTTIRSCPTRRR